MNYLDLPWLTLTYIELPWIIFKSFAKFHISIFLSEWLTDWVSDMAYPWDAYASKNAFEGRNLAGTKSIFGSSSAIYAFLPYCWLGFIDTALEKFTLDKISDMQKFLNCFVHICLVFLCRPGNNSRLSGNPTKCQNIFCNGTEHIHTILI